MTMGAHKDLFEQSNRYVSVGVSYWDDLLAPTACKGVNGNLQSCKLSHFDAHTIELDWIGYAKSNYHIQSY